MSGNGAQTQFLAQIDSPVGYAATVLPDPYRVVIDVPDLAFDMPPGEGRKAQGLVKSVRYGIVEKGKSRIVIDTDRECKFAEPRGYIIGQADVFAGRDFATAFEHSHPLASAGQARGRDAAAITGADHDHVVARLQGRGRLRQPHG